MPFVTPVLAPLTVYDFVLYVEGIVDTTRRGNTVTVVVALLLHSTVGTEGITRLAGWRLGPSIPAAETHKKT